MTSFIPDEAKVNAKLCVELCCLVLLKNASLFYSLSGFIFQQDGLPAHTAKLAQDWISTNCSEFIGKDEWPQNSSDINPLDYRVCSRCFNTTRHFILSQRTLMD